MAMYAMSAERIVRLRERLENSLNIEQLEIIDESHKHAGHAGAADGRGHFKVIISASDFDGLRQIKRHQLIYAAVGDMMQTDIHALSIIIDGSST